MTLDVRLLALLVCPVCKGALVGVHEHANLAALACKADRLAFPVRDGIPLMLESEARGYDPDTGHVLARAATGHGAASE